MNKKIAEDVSDSRCPYCEGSGESNEDGDCLFCEGTGIKFLENKEEVKNDNN